MRAKTNKNSMRLQQTPDGRRERSRLGTPPTNISFSHNVLVILLLMLVLFLSSSSSSWSSSLEEFGSIIIIDDDDRVVRQWCRLERGRTSVVAGRRGISEVRGGGIPLLNDDGARWNPVQDFVVIARTRMDNIIMGGWGGLRRAFVAFALILFTPVHWSVSTSRVTTGRYSTVSYYRTRRRQQQKNNKDLSQLKSKPARSGP